MERPMRGADLPQLAPRLRLNSRNWVLIVLGDELTDPYPRVDDPAVCIAVESIRVPRRVRLLGA
jgi:hypothetical protein